MKDVTNNYLNENDNLNFLDDICDKNLNEFIYPINFLLI